MSWMYTLLFVFTHCLQGGAQLLSGAAMGHELSMSSFCSKVYWQNA